MQETGIFAHEFASVESKKPEQAATDPSQVHLEIPESELAGAKIDKTHLREPSDKILINIESARMNSEMGHTTKDFRVNMTSQKTQEGAPSVANSTVRAESLT